MTQIPNQPVAQPAVQPAQPVAQPVVQAAQPVVQTVVHNADCEVSMNFPDPVCTCPKQAVTQEVVTPVVTEPQV